MGVWDSITDNWAEDALPTYASSVTPDEEAAGFHVVHADVDPYAAVVRSIDDRVLVLKMQDPITRAVIYAVVTRGDWTPVAGFTTLRALLAQFPIAQ